MDQTIYPDGATSSGLGETMLGALLLTGLLSLASPTDDHATGTDYVHCREAPLVPWAAGENPADGYVRIWFNNTDATQSIEARLCFFDAAGIKRSESVYTLGPRSGAILALPVPVGRFNASADVSIDGTPRFGAGGLLDLGACPNHAAQWTGEYFRLVAEGVQGHAGTCIPWTPVGAQEESRTVPPPVRFQGNSSGWTWTGIGLVGLSLGFGTFRARDAMLGAAYGAYARMRGHSVLEQSVRGQIHQLVIQEPGIYGRAIANQLELARGQALHHLGVLTRERILVGLASRGLRHYFVAGRYGPLQMRALALLRSPVAAQLLNIVLAEPGVSLGEAAARAGMSLSHASKMVQRLEANQLIEATQDLRSLRLRAGPMAMVAQSADT